MNNYLGENIKKLRKGEGATQLELAQELNITKSTVSEWERGNNRPTTNRLKELANYFNVTVSELLGEEPLRSEIPIDRLKELNKLYNEIEIEKMTEEEQKQFFLMAKTLAKGIKQK